MSQAGFSVAHVDELYSQYLKDPQSVSQSWRDFFATYERRTGEKSGGNVETGAAKVDQPSKEHTKLKAPAPEDHAGKPLTGIAAKIAENMEESLTVPTATSVRSIPVKLLEENRKIINYHQQLSAAPRISFTHLIAWAIVRALQRNMGMNAGYTVVDSKPARVVRSSINLGLAIDLEKRGERILLVPNLKDAGAYSFPDFLEAYNDLVKRARDNKLSLDDFNDTTVTITNPGMLGTALSVPRLMKGQGAIFGIGSIGYPSEYAGMSPHVIAELGLSKVMEITSTYDHRVIQGAESGAFLHTVHQLLVGEHDFYDTIFEQLQVPHEPIDWGRDLHPFEEEEHGAGTSKDARVLQLIRAHRVRGHLWANLDPLGVSLPKPQPELELSTYGLSVWDLDREFPVGVLGGERGRKSLREILDTIRQTYCRYIGVEFMHIPDPVHREWLQERMERNNGQVLTTPEVQRRIIEKLNIAEAFERFLHTAYIGHKRFSLEGAETLIPMTDALLNRAADAELKQAVIGMAHRGRLNVLANTIGKSHGVIFREFEGDVDPDSAHGSGDVKYHRGAQGVHTSPRGKTIKVSVASNPSHLEAVDPVLEGMTRALQDLAGDVERKSILPILIHGDAAFSGQGVVVETLNLSQLFGYRTGGTVHIIINNQIGFTTNPEDLRSSLYCTDVAKAVHAPILHVNGDHPECALAAIDIALEYRQRFGCDVVVDLVCYRRWGHNEGDDPSYTQPLIYEKIHEHPSVRKRYTDELLRRGDIGTEAAEKAMDDFRAKLQEVHDEVQEASKQKVDRPYIPPEADRTHEPLETGASESLLLEVLDGLDGVPEGFQIHPKLTKQLQRRKSYFNEDRIDWGLGEALGFGTLVLEGYPVRISGEDSGRGTFSHRHAALVDHRNGAKHVPLANLRDDQAPFTIYDSLLSEFAVLGFEYGYSVVRDKGLVCWEAQFGDFSNGAQVIIDQFVSSAEDKWMQQSNLTMMLPHGFEGQGPEHSSARIERYLQLAAEDNMRVCYPTTPAQMFHLLRRQAMLKPRKPLIIFTPKSLLRLPAAVSRKEEFMEGSYRRVIGDPKATGKERRVNFCSGKVYYDLAAYRDKHNIGDVALVRMEQYYPFPDKEVQEIMNAHPKAKAFYWVQEEPRNMGAWDFLDELMHEVLGDRGPLKYFGRPASASPASGSSKRHAIEQEELCRKAFE